MQDLAPKIFKTKNERIFKQINENLIRFSKWKKNSQIWRQKHPYKFRKNCLNKTLLVKKKKVKMRGVVSRYFFHSS